ncbi:uncharacterized protein FPRO_15145 [Fusarium proliferatum ET1]|uniref:Secreted protein n=1 Tax=Fusarium proliferatum (strain ET1) TaxID=1227346 RepID=A0A1L7VZ25_FUSPR|nr:uncharacterized protein FPRO_15145 [Fusarium proliferatum ET1]CVL05547.1 uncharacterized protein FPRN_14361 [Fusarium proliferatum]CZR45679.1 uncharacterized protein FPRO_15145 [Fusarium proliferatum ET1]
MFLGRWGSVVVVPSLLCCRSEGGGVDAPGYHVRSPSEDATSHCTAFENATP